MACMCILVSSLSIFLYLFNTGDFRIPYRCSLKISGPPFQRFDSVDLRFVCDFAFLTLFQVMLQLLVQEQCFEKHCCGTILPRESMHFALLLTTNSYAEAASSPVGGLALGLPLTRLVSVQLWVKISMPSLPQMEVLSPISSCLLSSSCLNILSIF